MRLNKVVWTGIITAATGVLPLLAYILLGPKDGNPIGLGLMFISLTPIGIIISLVGWSIR